MKNLKEKYKEEIAPALKKKFGYKTVAAAPKILKLVVSTGVGSVKDDSRKEEIKKTMAAITGQEPKTDRAKKSIASFKTREGMPLGYSVTLRGARMYNFLNKLINAALPRTRDFQGISQDVIDKGGNITVGIKEHIIFPETSKDDVRRAFGLGVTIATNAKTKEELVELLKLFNFPFKK